MPPARESAPDPAPLICTALVAWTGSLYTVEGYMIVLALISFSCSYLMAATVRRGLPVDKRVS